MKVLSTSRINTIEYNRYGHNVWKGYNYLSNKVLIQFDNQEEYERFEKAAHTSEVTIVDGDVIYFQDSTFPKLFVKEVTDKIKRTVKESKATKIVTDSKNIITSGSFDQLVPCLIYEDENSEYFEPSSELIAQTKIYETVVENLSKLELTYFIPEELCNAFMKFSVNGQSNKLVSTYQLINYLNQFLILPDESEKETLISLFSSSDQANMALAINLSRTFNLSDSIIDIYIALGGENWQDRVVSPENRASVRWKYLMSYGATTYSHLKYINAYYDYSNRGKNILTNLYHLPFLSLAQKQKCWIHMYCKVKRIDHKDFNDLSIKDMNKLTLDKMKLYGFPAAFKDIS